MDLLKLMSTVELLQVAVFFVLNILLEEKFCKRTDPVLFFFFFKRNWLNSAVYYLET